MNILDSIMLSVTDVNTNPSAYLGPGRIIRSPSYNVCWHINKYTQSNTTIFAIVEAIFGSLVDEQLEHEVTEVIGND